MTEARIDRVTSEDWNQLVGTEPAPWGNVGETLAWRDKDQHVTIRDAGGRPLAVAGSAVAQVRIQAPSGGEPCAFAALGIGSVFVKASERGRGLAGEVLERLLELGREREPQRAMLFCLPDRMGLYAKFGFQAIADPVWAGQPGGARIEMPLRAMWLALEPRLDWPAGRVDVLGLPF